MEANLLITHDSSHAGSAKEEVEKALKEVSEKAKFLKSDVDGVFKIRVRNAREVVRRISRLKKKKGIFEHTFHWIPIDRWVQANVKAMQKALKSLKKGIKTTEKWKLDLQKRHFEMPSSELVMKLTEVVDKPKVDLDNPQKIVEVQIMGKKAGLALLDRDDVLKL